MRFPRILLPVAIAATLGVVGCGDDNNITTPTPVATQVQIVSGNTQSGTRGTALANPVIVRVVDQNGNAFAGATVTFAVASGGGTISPTTTTTGTNGQAQATWTLGSTAGANTITATAGSLTPVTFTATGT